MTKATAPFFSPLDINTRTIKNRLAVAPMTRVTATEDGRATETMTRYYERFARGGFGMIVSEGIYTDQAFSQGYIFQPGISDDEQARSWQPVVKGIKSHGALAVAQIMHSGAISQGNRFRDGTVGPSAIQPKGKQMTFYYGEGSYATPSTITDEQLADAVAGFGSAASRAIETAGFDAIELHGANGYLLDQFLTDYTNQRTDRWGGDTRSRMEAIVATLSAVREAVGADVPVGIRLSQGKVNDFEHKWRGAEKDAEVIFGTLADAGADFIHVTEFEAWQPAFAGADPTLAYFAKRYARGVPIIANGGLHDVTQARAVLADDADIVTLGRGALANPDFPNRLLTGAPMNEFDPSILGPIADIKASELAL